MELEMKFVAKTLFGLEDILVKELELLGAQNIVKVNRAVLFEGDKALLYKANLALRTALSILVHVDEYEVRNENDLYKCIQHINWMRYISVEETFKVDSVVKSEHFKHSKYVALKTKDAIVDQFRKYKDARPSIDTYAPDLQVNVHIYENRLTVSLNSSGDALFKRGYRVEQHRAPLNEVLAAGMILLSEWDKNSPFIDGMCGSGTLPIEAAMIAYNIAPNLNRRRFGLMKWKDFDLELWNKVKAELQAQILPAPEHKIIRGSDSHFKYVRMAERHVEQAGLKDYVTIERKNFFRSSSLHGKGVVMMNPPYGERIGEGDISELYGEIGDQLKNDFEGYDAWLISSNKSALKRVGLRPSKKLALYNGSLECKFHKYEMYRGSKEK